MQEAAPSEEQAVLLRVLPTLMFGDADYCFAA